MWWIFSIVMLILLSLLATSIIFPRKLKNVENRHVVITGGSSGIGKSFAVIAARNGAHVTIIARNVEKLEAARDEVIAACKNQDKQKVEYLSLDVSRDYKEVETALSDLESRMGPIYMFMNCAGTAICDKIEDVKVEDLQTMINLNFLGTFYCAKAVVPKMKAANEGIIVVTASQIALFGLYGYSAYCGTKFALRGMAESMAMEVFPYNISVTLGLPLDTDTPGFEVEERTKPLETKLLSESAGLWSPDTVAEKIFKDAMASKFFSHMGVAGFVLTTLCTGMSPFSSWWEVFVQAILMGPLRIVGACYIVWFHKVIRNCSKLKDSHKKSS